MNRILKITIRWLTMGVIGLSLALMAWFGYLTIYSDHACRTFYSDQFAEVQSVTEYVLEFRRQHGRLPRPAEAAYVGYRLDSPDTFEVYFLSFDGPTIKYSGKAAEYICEL